MTRPLEQADACTCGEPLAPRGELVLQLRAVLTGLLALTKSPPTVDVEAAALMHRVLRVQLSLEICPACADERIAGAVLEVVGRTLAPRQRRPYTAPAIARTTGLGLSPLERFGIDVKTPWSRKGGSDAS